ncbi:MAG TPA: hypothetical protein PLS49_01725 [Candidatus Woesebacteria bacterium]|nr:hypothetical protein [Candidatus Woesebacteria bacterium]
MRTDYKLIKTFLQNKHFYPTIIIVFLDIVLLGVLIYMGFQLHGTYNEMIASQDKVQQMKATITLIRNNQTIFDGRIDEYNTTLERLIPDAESYFSVISTLEQLSARTGVTINSYSVNLDATTEEKLTLSVTIMGDPTAIEKFIQEYQYAGGRLLTTDGLNINPQELESVTFSLNFYHNEFKDAVSSSSQVKTSDLELLEEIRTKL